MSQETNGGPVNAGADGNTPDGDNAPADLADYKLIERNFDKLYSEENGAYRNKETGELEMGEDGQPLTKEALIEKRARELHPKDKGAELNIGEITGKWMVKTAKLATLDV
jgi:hypothetical protein